MGLLTPDFRPLQPGPATQLALNLRATLPLQQPQMGTVGLAKPGPKRDRGIP